MKKIVLTTVIGLVAAVLVGVWYFSNLYKETSPAVLSEGTEISVATTTAGDSLVGKDSLTALLTLGKSLECTFSFSSEGVRGEGSAFYDDGLARIDSLYLDESNQNMSSYLIIDSNNEVMYSWFTNDGLTQGVKLSTKVPSDQTAVVKDITKPETVTPDTPVQYDCKPWVADRSVFVPPSEIEFTDMSDMQKMMEDMQKNIGQMNIPSN